MMCSDSDAQIGRSDWTRRMMNMPATNISQSSTTAPPPSASSPSSAAAAKAAVTQQQPSQQQDHRPAGPLRCPRCDSANTKFCYYNNYSLSQPRHFCKACKRYWTRGGTLRNVPVGGGCRKNKRVKKHHNRPTTTTVTATASATVTATNTDPRPPPPHPLPTSSDLSPFFYGLTTSDVNFPGTAAAYDALGIGDLIPASNQLIMSNNLADLQHQQPSSSSFLHHNEYLSSFGSQAASLFMSSLKHPKKAEDQYGQSLLPYDSANLGFLKDVKVEGDRNNNLNLMTHNISTEWQAGGYPFEANINGAADASFLYWNPAMGGAAGWPDGANSSVAPLI